jgi:hypothetical protein
LETCWAAIESTVAWIVAVGMLGSKIITFGPKSGWLDARSGASGAGAALADVMDNGLSNCPNASSAVNTTRAV